MIPVYRTEPVTADGLQYLLDHLWPRGVEELRRLGLTHEQALRRFMGYAGRGRAGVLSADDVPLIATGTCTEDGERFTWFIATDAFEQHPIAITRFLRRHLQTEPTPIHIYSVCIHPDTARWFAALGFRRSEHWIGTTPAGYPIWRFVRD